MKNKGFTLVELLAVIVILGVLMTIAIPSILGVSKNVKEKSYLTKIEMIENAAKGSVNKNVKDTLIRDSKVNSSGKYNDAIAGYTWMKVIKDGKKIGVVENASREEMEKGLKSGEVLHYAYITTVGRLASNGDLDYDDKSTKDIQNPTNNKSILECNVYIYLKNNRAYAVFDRIHCN